jgi:hypothetical protein
MNVTHLNHGPKVGDSCLKTLLLDKGWGSNQGSDLLDVASADDGSDDGVKEAHYARDMPVHVSRA